MHRFCSALLMILSVGSVHATPSTKPPQPPKGPVEGKGGRRSETGKIKIVQQALKQSDRSARGLIAALEGEE